MRYSGNDIKLLVNNLLVSYTDEGPDEGPVIIFIHGFPLNKSMWNKQVDALKTNYRVISYDIRGHGMAFEMQAQELLTRNGIVSQEECVGRVFNRWFFRKQL